MNLGIIKKIITRITEQFKNVIFQKNVKTVVVNGEEKEKVIR
jgi:hypothetical protein